MFMKRQEFMQYKVGTIAMEQDFNMAKFEDARLP